MASGRKYNHITPTDKKHTIKALKAENRMLRAELKRLSRIIRANSIESDLKKASKNESVSLWQNEEKEAVLLTSSSYVKYLVSKITGGSLFSYSKKAMGYFRKFKLVSSVMRTASSILAILGTGAFFIFLSGTLVFIIPFIVAFCITIYFLGTISRARSFKRIEKAIKDKNVFVFFPNHARCFDNNSPLRDTVDIISTGTENNNFIIIISPYVFGTKGINRSGFYAIARFEKNNVCMLRRHSFFLLRKRLLGPAEARTTYVY